MNGNIHQGQPVIKIGAEIDATRLLVIILHGRGSNAQGMLPLAEALHIEGTRFLIPQGGLNRWYPRPAFDPLETNEPDLSSALDMIAGLVEDAHENGFSDQQIALGGFSQGACLASEFAARNAMKYAGLFILSGALIGPRGISRDYQGTFDNMPVLIGGCDVDPWVAHDLISNTATTFRKMGAEVDFRTYPGMGHTINQDEIDHVKTMLTRAIAEFVT